MKRTIKKMRYVPSRKTMQRAIHDASLIKDSMLEDLGALLKYENPDAFTMKIVTRYSDEYLKSLNE